MSDTGENDVLGTEGPGEEAPRETASGDADDELDDEPLGPDGGRQQRLAHSFVGGHAVQGDGNLTFRDLNFGFTASSRWIGGPRTPEEIDRWRATYEPVSAYRQLVQRLRHLPVQVLYGPPGSGRWTTAVLALARLRSEAVSVQVATAEGLDEVPFVRRGYAVEHPGSPSSTELADLRYKAALAGALIVLVVDQDAAGRPALDSSDLVLMTPPEQTAVLRRHLEYRLTADQLETLYKRLKTGELAPAFEIWQEAPHPIQKVVELAEDLCAYAAGASTEAYVTNSLKSAQWTNVRGWLELATDTDQKAPDIPSLSDAALLLSATVLDRLPLRYATWAAEELTRRLQEVETPDGPRTRHVFHNSLAVCGDWLRVSDSQYWERPPSGRRTRHVQLHSSNLRRIILEVVWLHFVTLHDQLANWLRWLAGDFSGKFRRGDTIVRQVAEAVAILATLDFDQVHRLMLSPWARGSNGRLSDAAAAALVFTSREQGTASAVRTALREWADSTSSKNRQEAALRAFELGVNAPFPASVRQLIDLADRLDGATGRAIPVLAALLDAGSAEVVLQALAQQRGPDRHTDPDPHVVQCLLDLQDHAPDSLAGGFLNAIIGHRQRAQALARLLGTAFTQDATAGRAWALVRDWVAQAGEQPDLVPPLADLLGALATDWPLRTRLRFALPLWTHRFCLSDATVRAIRSRIDHNPAEGSNGPGAA